MRVGAVLPGYTRNHLRLCLASSMFQSENGKTADVVCCLEESVGPSWALQVNKDTTPPDLKQRLRQMERGHRSELVTQDG